MTKGYLVEFCSNECHVTPTFKFQTVSPDLKAAINTRPSAALQINIIGVHYMLIESTFLSSILHP